MRYHEIMAEAIVNRPRNLKVYLDKRIKELGQMAEMLVRADTLIKDNASDGDHLLRYAFRHAAADTPDEGFGDYYIFESNLEYWFHIERLHNALEAYERYHTDRRHDFLKYVMSALEDSRKEQEAKQQYIEQMQTTIRLLPRVEMGFKEYGYEPGNPEHEADPEYIAARNMLEGYRLKAKVIERIIPLESDLYTKLSAVQHFTSHYGDREKYRPEHGDVETLYHATAYVREILRDGFQAEKPEHRKGVGNFGTQNTISFAHDLEIARTIMRGFKELWMIAHGQLTGRQIMGWADAEGIGDAVVKNWGGMHRRDLPLNPGADPVDVALLYRYWNTHTKLRQNPMIVNLSEIIEVMKHRTIKDIGVLACEVRLQQPEEEYKWAETEFRLPADRVLSIKQVL